MIKLKVKLAWFNLFSKLLFTGLFLVFMPGIVERINLRQVDNELVKNREQVIDIIAAIGIEPFIADTINVFGSFNILKDEFISLEKVDFTEDLNFIEVSRRLIEGEQIGYRVINYTFLVDGQKYLLEIGKSLTSITQAKKNITRIILAFLVFIIIITLITDLQYHSILLKPLDKIMLKLNGISNPSAFDRTEIRTTTLDFHQLDHTLKELMDRINELFRKEQDITVNISHELLTPVSIVRSKLENLILAENTDPEISIKIEESLKTLYRLQSLVNSLMFIARIESRQYLLEESFSVRELLEEIVYELNPIAEDSGIKIEKGLTQSCQIRKANRSLLFSMFYNIVNNSVKNTSTGGRISITCFPGTKEKTNVIVSDTGKGMTDAQIKTLFLRFKSRTEINETGAGIGLAIAKSIADLHNINVSVSSEKGKGTIFSFIFP